jgi:hypothetical protein
LLSDLCESFGFSLETVVLAPPDACTTPDCGSSVDSVVEEPAGVSEELDDDAVDGVDVDDVDVESAGASVPDESVCAEVPVSASAIPGLLAIATPSPNATASAPTLPMYLAQPACDAR